MSGKNSEAATLKSIRSSTPSNHEVVERLLIAQDASDYEAAMIGSALVEHMLKQIILTKFIKLNKNEYEALFDSGGRGPLDSLSSKTRVSHALGLISRKTAKQVDIIRTVRNHFAHSHTPASFVDGAVKSETMKLYDCKINPLGKEYFQFTKHDAKLRYVITCLWLGIFIANHISSIGFPHERENDIPIDCFE